MCKYNAVIKPVDQKSKLIDLLSEMRVIFSTKSFQFHLLGGRGADIFLLGLWGGGGGGSFKICFNSVVYQHTT